MAQSRSQVGDRTWASLVAANFDAWFDRRKGSRLQVAVDYPAFMT
jgi:hypothetical protein